MNSAIAFFVLLCMTAATSVHASEAPQQALTAGGQELRIAVLPLENLTGSSAPLKEIRRVLSRKILTLGKRVVDDDALEACLSRHRFRYTGGVDPMMAQVFRDEIAANAVLVTSLETYAPGSVPKIALSCRLVSTEQTPRIIWMESVGLAGNDAPGLLNLGVISDLQTLRDNALRQLVRSLAAFLANRAGRPSTGWGDRAFRPRRFFAGADTGTAASAGKSVVVMPFFNKSKRRNANQITLLHFVRELWGVDGITVVEPGVVRHRMLALRTIMKEGFTYRDMDLIAGESKYDVFLSGKVYQYQDTQVAEAAPAIDFFSVAVERDGRKTIWSSHSYNKGDDPVYFFDIGRVNSANVLAAKMVRAIALKLFDGG